MHLDVIFFAPYRELAGRNRLPLDLPEVATVAEFTTARRPSTPTTTSEPAASLTGRAGQPPP